MELILNAARDDNEAVEMLGTVIESPIEDHLEWESFSLKHRFRV